MNVPTHAELSGHIYLELQRVARRQGRGTQEMFTFYVLERFLYRLSISPFADRFILKGGLLLAVLEARRPTKDADFLMQALPAEEELVLQRVREIAACR